MKKVIPVVATTVLAVGVAFSGPAYAAPKEDHKQNQEHKQENKKEDKKGNNKEENNKEIRKKIKSRAKKKVRHSNLNLLMSN